MSYPTPLTDKPLDYSFLLMTYMVCAEQQIHSRALKCLRDLARQTRVGQRTSEEIEKILAQDEHLITLEDVAQGVPQERRDEALRQVLVMACIDGFYSPLEREMVERVARFWQWSAEKIQPFHIEAETLAVALAIDNDSALHDSDLKCPRCKSTQFKKNGRRLGKQNYICRYCGRHFVESSSSYTGGTQSVDITSLDFFAEVDYEAALRLCAEIAHEDYTFAEAALKQTLETLENLDKGIQNKIKAIQNKNRGNVKAETAKDVANQLLETKQKLEVEIVKKVEVVQELLFAKQRSLKYFTIAFMGRTKAGKSTLHAVITGEGWEGIGIGNTISK